VKEGEIVGLALIETVLMRERGGDDVDNLLIYV
jgi:hypothetical protein